MFASLLVLLSVAIDPRVELVTLQQDDRKREALKVAERMLDTEPDSARALGVEYLAAHLLETLGHPRDAIVAYASVMRTQPALRPYALLRVADLQSELGHPELSSGLLVSLLENNPPPPLLQNGERLLIRALEQGGEMPRARRPGAREAAAFDAGVAWCSIGSTACRRTTALAPTRCSICCARTAPISRRAWPRADC